MFQFETTTEATHKAVRRRIECALETGNYNEARTVMDEYAHEYPQDAINLRVELVPLYNVHL